MMTHGLHSALKLGSLIALTILLAGFDQPLQAQVAAASAQPGESISFALEGTELLKAPVTDAIYEEQRQEIIHYFQKRIAATPAARDGRWRPDFSSLAAYKASVQTHQTDLRTMLGLIERKPGTPSTHVLAEEGALRIEEVTIPIDTGFEGRALLFLPRASSAAVIAISPATESREEFVGLVHGVTPAKWLTALLSRNIAVAVPLTVERRKDCAECQEAGYKDQRRILWRAGFIVGRTLVGVEVQEVLALREFLAKQPGITAGKIAVMGEGQGGMTALYAAARDEGFAAAAIIDYFQQRENCWQEPVDTVLYGQLNEFGDAEVAALIAPRPLFIVHSSKGPTSAVSVKAEFTRAQRFYRGLGKEGKISNLEVEGDALNAGALQIASQLGLARASNPPELTLRFSSEAAKRAGDEEFEALLKYLRGLCVASDQVRADYWKLSSTPPAERRQKAQRLRKELANLEGVIPTENVPLHPRTALVAETDKFLAYNVFLDVAPGLKEYGQLLVPRRIAGHMESRYPVVICQHGFDSHPGVVTGAEINPAPDVGYHLFAQRLAERGYVVYAPYMTVPMSHESDEAHGPNPTGLPDIVHMADLTAPLVRLAATLGVMRTSVELAKLHRVVDFLQSLPFVDADHIGFYGLSYGGYAAIWMPPLEPRIKVTVISAFFNDWRAMLTDTNRFGGEYWSLPDEDFYNWNVLNRFTHTELSAAMWPRPLCVEYGVHDPVTTPVWHKREATEVKTLMDSWGMGDKVRDEVFDGTHAIHGIGTFFFLDQFLRPQRPAGRDYGCQGDYCNLFIAPGLHGYSPASTTSAPYVTQFLDSDRSSAIHGRFYVPPNSPELTGIALKIARAGNAGDLRVKFGSVKGSADLGIAMIHAKDVYPAYDLWYEAALDHPVHLDPDKTYYFELDTVSGQAPTDGYTVFGPTPLGGKDFPSNFGLSFQTLVRKSK